MLRYKDGFSEAERVLMKRSELLNYKLFLTFSSKTFPYFKNYM